MNLEALGGALARHVLTLFAGSLVASGFLTDAQVEPFIGAGMFFATLGWSAWQKRRQTKVTAVLAKMGPVAPPSASVTEAAAIGEQAAKRLT